MAPSRCLPEPAVLQRLLAGAGVRAARVGEESLDSEWIHFDDGPPPRGTSPVVAATKPAAKVVSSPPPRSQPSPRPPVAGSRIEDIRDATPRSSTRAPEAPLGEPTDQRLSEEVFGSARGLGVEQRLQKLVSWLVASTGSVSAFVADLEGLPLVNRNTPEPYIVAIGPLARAQAEIARFVPDSPPGTSIVELDHQNMLEVVWADTPIGRLGVGIIVAEPLKSALVTRIRRVAALSVVSRGDT